MLKSMTGYGKAEYRNERFDVEAEIRSVNNRYLEINMRLPKNIANFEFELKEVIKKRLLRGKINVAITLKDKTEEMSGFVLKEEAVNFYLDILNKIKNKTGLNEPVKLEHLLHFSDIIEPQEEDYNEDEIKKPVIKTLNIALDNLISMREQEGKNISGDISRRIKNIAKKLNFVFEKGKTTPREELMKLTDRINDLLQEQKADENRLEMELALIADRVDITEECIRLKSHIELFTQTLQNSSEVGKKLTFILQEMLREVNTIGSKTTDIEISHGGIFIKEEIEKLREQVQNLE